MSVSTVEEQLDNVANSRPIFEMPKKLAQLSLIRAYDHHLLAYDRKFGRNSEVTHFTRQNLQDGLRTLIHALVERGDNREPSPTDVQAIDDDIVFGGLHFYTMYAMLSDFFRRHHRRIVATQVENRRVTFAYHDPVARERQALNVAAQSYVSQRIFSRYGKHDAGTVQLYGYPRLEEGAGPH